MEEGMDRSKCAFAVCASGERHENYKRHLLRCLSQFVPGVDVVDIDISMSGGLLSAVPENERSYFMRLAIPVMDRFRKYDRVIWLDVDVDIVSPKFAGILDVETSSDGLAAARDINQDKMKAYLKRRFPDYDKPVFFNSGVMVMDLCKIDVESWCGKVADGIAAYMRDRPKWHDQDIFNKFFDINEIDGAYNALWMRKDIDTPYLVHYVDQRGKKMLDKIIADEKMAWKKRCVVVMPRHEFIRPWIRAYFATGNRTPLVIVTNQPGNWNEQDMEFCRRAAEYSGGMVFDCAAEWESSKDLKKRAMCHGYNPGWYTKKSILHAVATRLAPAEWAWIDDDIEFTGNIDECFDFAAKAPGFICAQFYYPDKDGRHVAKMQRCGTAEKPCWNSFVFFHGDVNERFRDLGQDFPVEDDEGVFGHLYNTSEAWHEGFQDISQFKWQAICKRLSQIPRNWKGKALHYAAREDKSAAKKMWAAKADMLPRAPFETPDCGSVTLGCAKDPIDAVFVIGTGTVDYNKELRYALRSLDQNCKFIRDVYICGECPTWVDLSKVKFLPWRDRFSHAKDSNIIDKLRHACEQKGIAKRILFCSDDQFQTKECSWSDFAPRYIMEFDPQDKWYEQQKRLWHSRLRSTLIREVNRRKSIGMSGAGVYYYQPHIWMPIDRDSFLDYAKWSQYETREDTIIASGYYNFANAAGVKCFDHVFLTGGESGIPAETHVAYNDGSYCVAMKILQELFPTPSRFEIVHAAPAETPIQRKIPEDEGFDPSPATQKEMSEIIEITSKIRGNRSFEGFLGEISRAEELRLFGVRGWRIVWQDIVARVNSQDVEPREYRSDIAQSVVDAYISNPGIMRTVSFGPQNAQIMKFSTSKDSLREKVRASLRTRAQ